MSEQRRAQYAAFLESKMPIAERCGFEPSLDAGDVLHPHQTDLARWCVRGGRRAVFASFGVGKTRINLQVAREVVAHTGGKFLIVAPLGVRQEFTLSDGPAMGVDIRYCRDDAEVAACPSPFIITNYERVRDGQITVSQFAGAALDEASVLRSFGSKTYQTFLGLFKAVPYRFVFTATPSPNKYKELIHYAGFLGVMDTGEALTRFFKRDSKKANNLTLYPHMEEQFWLWLSSWAAFIQKPSDLGYPDDGYDLPPVSVHWHAVGVDHTHAWSQTDSWGQAQLFMDGTSGFKELAASKRETVLARVMRAREIMGDKPLAHWLIWHDLEAERHVIENLIPAARTVYGTQDLDERENLIMAFSRGEFPILATKPIIAGSGCNFQRHCSDAVFLGSSYKFNDFIQAVHRIARYQQPQPVNIHVVYAESEQGVIDELRAKWVRHDELVARMTALLRRHGLQSDPHMHFTRSLGCNRAEVVSDRFRLIHNDTVLETLEMADNSVHFVCTSIPFGNQYEYTPSFNDFGHNTGDKPFFEQMDFLVPELLRVLKPGRVAAIHVKDRIQFGNVTGFARPSVNPFSDKTVAAFTRAGFIFSGRITIDTDVVRENSQTYRLGWSENAKDSTKMGVGMPEYVLLFYKLPSDLSDGYADEPVTKDKATYTRAQWQVDAAGLWKSSGNTLPAPEILVHMPMDAIGRVWREHALTHGYDYRQHVELGRELESRGKLPSSFMLFPPVSRQPHIWSDIARMRTLNTELSRRNQEGHVCPLQLDIIERLVARFTNKGEWVLDPFMGIGSVGYQAIQMGRCAVGSELNEEYWRHSVGYCEMAENEIAMPTLFDLGETEKGGVARA